MTAAAPGRNRCITCGKDNKATSRCGGCLEEYCFKHLLDHRQQLAKQLDEIEVTRDLFRQTLSQQTVEPQRHALIQQINDWECESIKMIQRTAKEARQTLLEHTSGQVKRIEVDLNELTDQLRQNRDDDDFLETDLQQWNEELKRLAKELSQPSNIHLQQNDTSLISKISVVTRAKMAGVPNIAVNAKWIQNGITIAGGNQAGDGVNQLKYPCGIYVDDNQTVYIADYGNHRIVEWKNGATSGRIVAGGNSQGNRADQFNKPRDVIIDRTTNSLIVCDYGNERVMRWPCQNGTCGDILISNVGCWGLAMDDDEYLYISDYDKHEVRRWRIGDSTGTVVAGGNGHGDRLDQLNGPSYIYIDQDHAVYISDNNNHRLMKWIKGAKEGIVVARSQGQGKGLIQLFEPRGIVGDQLGTVYVAEYGSHRVARYPKGATEGGIVIGGNGQYAQATQLPLASGLSFDQQGNLYVVDHRNHRVQKFIIDSSVNS